MYYNCDLMISGAHLDSIFYNRTIAEILYLKNVQKSIHNKQIASLVNSGKNILNIIIHTFYKLF